MKSPKKLDILIRFSTSLTSKVLICIVSNMEHMPFNFWYFLITKELVVRQDNLILKSGWIQIILKEIKNLSTKTMFSRIREC